MEQKEQKKKGWESDFYKNGYPQEVIVISDSPTPPPPSCLTSQDYATLNRKRTHHQDSFQPDLKRQKCNNNTNHIMNQSKFNKI